MPQALSSETFFSTWQHALQSDFAKDGQPATYFPGHPKHWGKETARIDRDVEGSLVLSLSDDGSLLGISNANGEVRIYDVPSFTLWRTLRGPRSPFGRSVEFQPSHGKSGMVLIGGGLVQGTKRREWIKSYELKNDDETEDLLEQAANVAALAAVETISKDVSRENIDYTKIRDGFYDALFGNQLEMRKGDVFEGSLVGGRTFSRDGSFFLFGKERNTIVVLDSESSQERYKLIGHTDYVVWAETSPDDTVIATSSWDQTVRVWDATNGQQLRVLTGATNQSWSGAFSPDGRLVCAGCGGSKVRVWDVESGELLHTLGGFQRWARSVAFSPDGKSLAGGSGGGVLKVFDVASGKEKQHWEVKKADPFGNTFIEIHSAYYTPKGLLVFKYGDGRVHTYNEETNQKGLYEHGPEIPSSAGYGTKLVTPDGKLLISADFDGRVRIWSLE